MEEVDIRAIREVLDNVEKSLKDALREAVTGSSSYRLDNRDYLQSALKSVQEASIELLKVR